MTAPSSHVGLEPRVALLRAQADQPLAKGAEIIDAEQAADLPTSFGVFKPVGHVMIGLPTQDQLNTLVAALQHEQWPKSALREFSPKDSTAELQAMIDKAGFASSAGYEITLLHRYLKLTQAGYRWLLVQVKDADSAASAADMARHCGATLALHYRTLTIEELIH
jgi:hypothetical protein